MIEYEVSECECWRRAPRQMIADSPDSLRISRPIIPLIRHFFGQTSKITPLSNTAQNEACAVPYPPVNGGDDNDGSACHVTWAVTPGPGRVRRDMGEPGAMRGLRRSGGGQHGALRAMKRGATITR